MKSIVISNLKSELKTYASEIRSTRQSFKATQREISATATYSPELWKKVNALEKTLVETRDLFRHKHIAYCLVRGRTIEQIEPNCKTGRNDKLIAVWVADYTKQLEAEKPAEVSDVATSP